MLLVFQIAGGILLVLVIIAALQRIIEGPHIIGGPYKSADSKDKK